MSSVIRKIRVFLFIIIGIVLLSSCGENSDNRNPVQTVAPEVSESVIEKIHDTPDIVESDSQASMEIPEIVQARELGILPEEWEYDQTKAADFTQFYQMAEALIAKSDASALSEWRKKVDPTMFPQRSMRRDDGLVLLMLAAESLGYNYYNSRDYGFCTEYMVDYDKMFSQLLNDYPYCDTEREVAVYFDASRENTDHIGNVTSSAIFWMQRRMDLSQRVHFLDCDEDLNFHLDEELTRQDAVSAVVRLYNSEMLEYDPVATKMRQQTEEDKKLLSEAEAVKQAILTNAEEYPCKGEAYYVSVTGNDNNDGRSPETAWKTLEKVNTAVLSPDDAVYFERGGTWRGQLRAQKGVIYSAYGKGAKPEIFASPENGAESEKWSLLEGTDNIWVYHKDMMDCGQIVFNDGESWGTKVLPFYMNGYLSTIKEGQAFDVVEELKEDLMFFSKADSILYDGAPFRYTVMDTIEDSSEDVVGTLYLRCDAGNPGNVFNRIEFSVRKNIVIPADGCVFHNLCLKYTGAHCIFGTDMGYDVCFCEIGWIGGSPQYYRYDTGEPVIMGNGVECDGSYDHFSVTDCYIYQCYDAGVSNQDPSEPSEVTGNTSYAPSDVVQRNITYAGNVFAYDDMPVEIFFTLEDAAGFGRHRMENVSIENNYFLYTGYGWYMENKDSAGAAYCGHNCPNASENFWITNNVFYLSTGYLLKTGAPEQWQPEIDGNTYIQNECGCFIFWPNEEGTPVSYTYNYSDSCDTVTDVAKNILKDDNAVLWKN